MRSTRGCAGAPEGRPSARCIIPARMCSVAARKERPTLRDLIQRPLRLTAPLVLNPLMARMAEAAGFPAGYLGGGSTGYQKVALEANLNVTEMCQTAVDIGAVSSLPLILDGACSYGDAMHTHRTIGMSAAAGFAAIEIEDQLVPKRAHHHAGIEHMIPSELMAAKVKEAVAARRNPDFLIVARTNAIRASDMDDALRRGEAYRRAGADLLLLSMAHKPEQLRAISERLGGPLEGRVRCRPSRGWGPAGRGARLDGRVRCRPSRGWGPAGRGARLDGRVRCRPSRGWGPAGRGARQINKRRWRCSRGTTTS